MGGARRTGRTVMELRNASGEVDGADGFPALADAHDGHVAVVHDAAENALVDVHAFDLVDAHLEGAALDEAGLVDNPEIGDVGLGGPAMEPCRRRSSTMRRARPGRIPPGTKARAPRSWSSATGRTGPLPGPTPRSPAKRTSSARWSNTAPSRRAAGFRRYNAPYVQPQLPLRHSLATTSRGMARNPLAPGRAARYTRVSVARASV